MLFNVLMEDSNVGLVVCQNLLEWMVDACRLGCALRRNAVQPSVHERAFVVEGGFRGASCGTGACGKNICEPGLLVGGVVIQNCLKGKTKVVVILGKEAAGALCVAIANIVCELLGEKGDVRLM